MFLFEIKVLEKQLFHSFEFYNCLAPLCSGLARGDGTFGQFDLNIYTRIYLRLSQIFGNKIFQLLLIVAVTSTVLNKLLPQSNFRKVRFSQPF